ncbi:MAG: DNA topoisomerase IV subunit A [Proteobacteria bacterium]|nr:DNA topoisomerase IV subunit A [Pseudomonadota bacterium]
MGGGGSEGPPPSLPELIGDGDALPLGLYAERSYLEYAVSVVKGRALPDVSDGQKPVQRRILYAMDELGLTATAKPVKSARVVGDVIGKYHPHGDQAAYDAMVRLAQDFSVRYPLIDGQGNFGSRDGDSAAAMRYTEARLTRYAELLLSEIDRGTVDFVPTYDGSGKEPALLPARLPMVLMNGASGIAVGMATEIPSHNLTEVASAAVALIENPELSVYDLMKHVPGPDFPGGAQIISSKTDILEAYKSGRGTLKVRARYKFEEMARGQWQVVITELPPGCSSQKVLEEIEELTNPKVKTGKKSLTQDQQQDKQLILSMLDTCRDESGKENAVRLVLEPKKSTIDRNEFVNTLLAYTSLESSASINMVMIGRDGRPRQKSLRQVLAEWIDFRFVTVRRRTEHRLQQVVDRIHILEGRHIVFLNVDEVIRIIRNADDPKLELIAAFNLSERQADDILEIRLRQLARLEGIKIEQELAELRKEQADLENLLTSDKAMRRQIIKEINADAKTFGDARRTLIEETERAVLTQTVVNEPLTVILSEKGWIRTRSGHSLELTNLSYKEGDRLLGKAECRSVDDVILLGSDGRSYSVQASQLPGGRGDGVPVTTLIDLQPKSRIVAMLAGAADHRYLLATSGGYGFMCKLGDMKASKKAGKAFITVEAAETVLEPVLYYESDDNLLAALSGNGRMLVFPLVEMKNLSGGGRGVIIMGLDDREALVDVLVIRSGVVVESMKRNKDKVQENISGATLQAFIGKRARKGRLASAKYKAQRLVPLTEGGGAAQASLDSIGPPPVEEGTLPLGD